MVIWSWRPFLCSSSVYSCHLLISSAFFFLVLYYAHLCVKCSFGISSSLEEISGLNNSNVFFYFFFCLFFHCTLKKALLSLLAILWNCAFRWVYLSFSPLPFTSLLFSDNHLAFLLLLGHGFWLLPAIQCTKDHYQWTAVIFSSIPRECPCHEGKETPRRNILYVTKQIASAVEHLFQ